MTSPLASPIARPAVARYDATHRRPAGPLLLATAGRDATPVVTAARLLAERLGAAPAVVALMEPMRVYLPGMVMEPVLPTIDAEQQRRLRDDVADAMRTVARGEVSVHPTAARVLATGRDRT